MNTFDPVTFLQTLMCFLAFCLSIVTILNIVFDKQH